ncbi:hypothetical protein DFH09DRAFT_1102288 [Mycena vulgaris]|nr:hypothetical protein DFH09DRAFT_1102288 [Mycena vulgaris]
MLCEAPFFPNKINYVDDAEHDVNGRKHWYLVLGVGLFTSKSDADARDPSPWSDGVLLFFTRAKADAKWASHCRKRHVHSDDEVVAESADGDSSSDSVKPTPTSPSCSTSLRSKVSASRNTSGPARASVRVKSEHVKSEHIKSERVKSERVKSEVDDHPLPLYLDDPTSIVPNADRSTSLKRIVRDAQPGSPKRVRSGAAETTPAPVRPIRATTTPVRAPATTPVRASAATPICRAPAATPIRAASRPLPINAINSDLSPPPSLKGALHAPRPAPRAPSAGVAPTAFGASSVSRGVRGLPLPMMPPMSVLTSSQMSPSVSSISSISSSSGAASSGAVSLGATSLGAVSASAASSDSVSLGAASLGAASSVDPFHDLGDSVLNRAAPPFGKVSFGRAMRSRPCTRGLSVSAASGSGGASASRNSQRGEVAPARLLYNNDTRTFYKDPARAVREMADLESIQVVEVDEVVGYLSSGKGRMAD